MAEHEPLEEFARVRAERDLYRRILDLGEHPDLEPFLREALALIVEVTAAQQGYLELYQDSYQPPRWWIACGFDNDQIDDVRSKISNTILARALATGKTIVTPSAMLDPQFDEFSSVRLKQIEAVLCAPIGSTPVIGVLYLQGRERPGLFDRDERQMAEMFARHLAPIAGRLIAEAEARSQTDPTAEYRRVLDLTGVVGRSQSLADVLKQVAIAAPVDVGVLLTGDCGTGKSQLAEVIHANSPRRSGPFVELNCGALPADLIESELFGAVAGAFTGATANRRGKVASAEGGTLFLDEISEIPLGAQSKLLQLLQKKTYYPLGDDAVATADIRLIAATNTDLPAAVRDKTFREDLFYRLNVLQIHVPPLAQRREDIAPLVDHFCRVACERHRLPTLRVSPGARRVAEGNPWPGNIRQLANACEVAAVRAAGENADAVEAHHLIPESTDEPSAPMTFTQATRRFQAGLLREVLASNDWNVMRTAEQLDLARSHIYTLMRTFKIER
jgi:Nif-specific regulatory protein